MEITVTPHRESSEVTLGIAASAAELAPYVRAAARHLSRARAIRGFRAGKAPVEVVERALGTERVLHEALDRAVPRLTAAAIAERQLEAIGRPAVSIERASRHEGVSFQARVAVLPEVRLAGLAALSIEQRPVTVTDEDVERELKQIARMRSQYLDVARAARDGDTVIVDWHITIDGAAAEGGTGTRQRVNLGEGFFVPDFEKGLLGMQAGEQREFTIVFPATFGRADWRGKSAAARVRAHAVQKRVQPEINDALAQQLGDWHNLATLRYALKSNLIREREQHEEERQRAALAAQLAANAEFSPLPAVLVEAELERGLHGLQHALERQQTTLTAYAAGRGTTTTAVREELREAAVQAVKVGLALRQFALEQHITVTTEEVEAAAAEYLRQFATPTQAKQAGEPQRIREHIGDILRNRKTLDRLREVALRGTR